MTIGRGAAPVVTPHLAMIHHLKRPAEAGQPERRSQCHPVQRRPTLKLAIERHPQTTENTGQLLEAANDYSPTPPPCAGVLSLYECGPCRPFTPIAGKGGARNRASRRSIALSEADTCKVLEAARRAIAIGLPFNRFITIHWERAGVTDPLGATGRYLKQAGDWIRVNGGRFAWAWVREGGDDKGQHVHILAHVSPGLTTGYNGRQRGWLRACGAAWRKGVILTHPVGWSAHHALGGGDDYAANLAGVLDYVLKGADHRARQVHGVKTSKPGGVVIGKRAGRSQNLGA
jgi:hypothetical protein